MAREGMATTRNRVVKVRWKEGRGLGERGEGPQGEAVSG